MTLMTQKIMLFVVINDLSLTFVISTSHLDFYRMFVLIFNSTKVLPSGWSNQFRQRTVTIEPSLNYRGMSVARNK